MTDSEFIDAVRKAKEDGCSEIFGELHAPVRGIRKVAIRNLDASRNGDHTDLWIESRSGAKVIGRCEIPGAKKSRCRLEGWPQMFARLDVDCVVN